MDYPLTLTRDDDGSLFVTCPDLPEVTSFGSDKADAIQHGSDAVEEAIAARMDMFADIPRPSRGDVHAHVSLALALKLELYWVLMDAQMTRADLARLTGWPRTKVDRLFDPNHESKLAQIEAAAAALGHHIELQMQAA